MYQTLLFLYYIYESLTGDKVAILMDVSLYKCYFQIIMQIIYDHHAVREMQTHQQNFFKTFAQLRHYFPHMRNKVEDSKRS